MKRPQAAQIATIGLTIAIIGLAWLIFSAAGQPMTGEAAAVEQYVDALCTADFDALYEVAAVPDHMSAEIFTSRAQAYLASGEIPQPCNGAANLNLVRHLPVPRDFDPRVTEIRLFQHIDLYTEDNGHVVLPLWVFRWQDGRWRVRPDFLGPVVEQPIASGELAAITDLNGIGAGYLQITGKARIYEQSSGALIGVPVSMRTLTRQWEFFDARLFMNDQQTLPLDNSDLLPENEHLDFISARGGYVPQNFELTGILWFRTNEIHEPVTLSFTAYAARSAAPPAAFLSVELPATGETIKPFNPFTAVEYAGIFDGNATFRVLIDATGLPTSQLSVACTSFVIETQSERWLRATECGFAPDVWTQLLLPGERIRADIRFVGYNLTENDLMGLSYRSQDNDNVTRFELWRSE